MAFQPFVVNIRLYLFLLYQELPQLQVSMLVFRCHIRFISISRSLYFDTLPNYPDDKFLSIGDISSTSKQEFLLWSLIVISGLLASIFCICIYCEIPKDCGAICINNRFWFMFIPVFMVWGFVMSADLPMDVLTDSVMSVFIFSRTYYRTAGN